MDLLQYLTRKLGEPAQDGDQLAFPCPKPGCHNEGNPHFRVKLDKRGGLGQCVKCRWVPKGDGWDIYKVIASLEKKSRQEIVRWLDTVPDFEDDGLFQRLMSDEDSEEEIPDADGPITVDLGHAPIAPKKKAVKKWNSWFSDILDPPTKLGLRARDYLFERGISREMILKHHLRYCDKSVPIPEGHRISQRFHGRVMIPIFNDGRVVFFQGRTFLKVPCDGCTGKKCKRCKGSGVTQPEPKYKNAKRGLDVLGRATDFLYGLDGVRGKNQVVSVEGAIDKIKLGDVAVSTLGKGMTDHRMRLLKGAGVRQLVIWFDPDVPQDERVAACKLASHYMPTLWTESLSSNKDAGAMTPAEHKLTLRAAKKMVFEDELELQTE